MKDLKGDSLPICSLAWLELRFKRKKIICPWFLNSVQKHYFSNNTKSYKKMVQFFSVCIHNIFASVLKGHPLKDVHVEIEKIWVLFPHTDIHRSYTFIPKKEKKEKENCRISCFTLL